MSRRSPKKEAITRSAIDLFKRYGIKRVTVTEICQVAGASKMTFYKHFGNKTELVKWVLEAWSDQLQARVDAIEALDVPFAEKVRLLVDEKVELAKELTPELIAELYSAGGELAAFIVEQGHANRRRFTDFIARAQARGDVRDDLEPALILAVLDKLNELPKDPTVLELVEDYVELTRQVNELFFYGVVARPDG